MAFLLLKLKGSIKKQTGKQQKKCHFIKNVYLCGGGIFKLKTLHLHILCICMIHVSEGEPVMAHVWRAEDNWRGSCLFSPCAFSETKHGLTGLVMSKDPHC